MKFGGLILLLISSPSFGCVFFQADTGKDFMALYNSAQRVLDAEDGKCGIDDPSKRSQCNCQYRAEPLVRFRREYHAFIKQYHSVIGDSSNICFQKESGETITIMLKGYEAITKMCLDSQ